MKAFPNAVVVLGAIHSAQAIRDSSYFFQSAKDSAKNAFNAGKEYAEQGAKWASENPVEAGCAAAGAAGIGMVAAPMLFAGPVLGAVGLSSTGPVAGGLFTAYQSIVGVTAGSIAATAQSAAMGGSGAAVISAAVQGAGVTVLGASGLVFWETSEKDDEKKEESGMDEKEK